MIKKKLALTLFFVSLLMFSTVPYSAGQEKTANVFVSPVLGAKFVFIPAGAFLMGSPKGELGRDADEGPQHQVTISRPFYMQTTEITQGQWKRVMGNNPSHFSSCGNDCPVENVSWEEVQHFIKKLNTMERTDKYRLPTEAQWEYAARAGTTTRFHTGDKDVDLSGAAWLKSNSGSSTHPVGQKTPNSWGLYDMSGNVYEWVWDWYHLYAPGRVSDPAGPLSGSKHVRRGGSWSSIARFCRSANRDYVAPSQRSGLLGFRLLRVQ